MRCQDDWALGSVGTVKVEGAGLGWVGLGYCMMLCYTVWWFYSTLARVALRFHLREFVYFRIYPPV